MQVLETAQQVGRFSVSSTPDVPYKEMADQCEALLVGKQQRMSAFMGVQQKPEISVSDFLQDLSNSRMQTYHVSEFLFGI